MRTDGTVERDVPLPGKQQEGIAVDAEGNVWVADDKDKSVLKLKGGLDTLRDQDAEDLEAQPQAGRATARPSQ
jgi:streptogramin lyase